MQSDVDFDIRMFARTFKRTAPIKRSCRSVTFQEAEGLADCYRNSV